MLQTKTEHFNICEDVVMFPVLLCKYIFLTILMFFKLLV